MDWQGGGEPHGQRDLCLHLEMTGEHSRQDAQVSRGTSWLLNLLSMVRVSRAGEGHWSKSVPKGSSSCPGAGVIWLENDLGPHGEGLQMPGFGMRFTG